jgi:23S rRNA (cytidine1920-2'-O)/16S rRNA (cytidine1409-2'-O)-methyltransferase
MEDCRLDVYLQMNNFADSREKAKQLIKNNSVYVNDKIATKASYKVNSSDKVDVKQSLTYVSRGALKIEKAINCFNICVENKTAVDIGASTGGFTDYLIKNNINKVYAIDVGHNQLHESLKSNERVINLEGTNFRYIDSSIFEDKIDLITVDVSFISLKLILPKIAEISNEDTDIIALIKPQFEAGRQNIGKNGIVKDKKVHLTVLNNVREYCLENGLYLKSVTISPIKGGDGNIEYLGHIKKGLGKGTINDINIKDLIIQAFDKKIEFMR